MKATSPEEQLATFIARYAPDVAAVATTALAKLRSRLPGAIELVYDNYNALAIGFGPTERPADLIFSLTLYPRWVSLFFTKAALLPDPHKLLKGSGKAIRHIVLDDPAVLDRPAVCALMNAALKRAATPLDAKSANRTIIKSTSPKQRPRRPA